jgi:hypothetical protein
MDLINTPMLQGLLGRHSQGVMHLAEPGPDESRLLTMTQAALRAPTRGLTPCSRGEAQRKPVRSGALSMLPFAPLLCRLEPQELHTWPRTSLSTKTCWTELSE